MSFLNNIHVMTPPWIAVVLAKNALVLAGVACLAVIAGVQRLFYFIKKRKNTVDK